MMDPCDVFVLRACLQLEPVVGHPCIFQGSPAYFFPANKQLSTHRNPQRRFKQTFALLNGLQSTPQEDVECELCGTGGENVLPATCSVADSPALPTSLCFLPRPQGTVFISFPVPMSWLLPPCQGPPPLAFIINLRVRHKPELFPPHAVAGKLRFVSKSGAGEKGTHVALALLHLQPLLFRFFGQP